MNTSDPKSFTCSTEIKCDVSFTSDNHLTVHKQHDITLNLGVTNKANSAFIADQTPTPTRLIKNCEDVGLFDDLKHVNPFDETFRRAVASKNDANNVEIISVSDDLNQSENSLHTPQVFPQYETTAGASTTPVIATEYSGFKVEKQQLILSDNIPEKQKRPPKKCRPTKKADLKSNVPQKPPNILPAPANAISPIILPVAVNLVTTTPFLTFSVPETTGKNHPLLLPKSPALTTGNPQPQKQISVKDKLKAQLINQKYKLTSTSSNANENTAKYIINRVSSINTKRTCQDSRDDQMERRRAAALRYRTKMKKESNDLKRRNAELIAENKQLKETVQKLKELLSAHQHCSFSSNESKTATKTSTPPNSVVSRALPAIQIPMFTPVNLFVRSESVPFKINQCLAEPQL